MKIFKLILAISLISVTAPGLFAEDSTAKVGDLSGDHRTGYLIPFVGSKDPAAMKAELDKQNYVNGAAEKMPELKADNRINNPSSNGIRDVQYDENGNVISLTQDDGTIVDYKFNGDNELTLESRQDGVSVHFSDNAITSKADGGKASRGMLIELYLKTPLVAGISARPVDGNSGILNPAFKAACPGTAVPVSKLAATPMKFDFKEIKKALEKTSKIRAVALKEYYHSASGYYDAIAASIIKNTVSLEGEGIELSGIDGQVSAENKRKAVDIIVENIYAYARKGGTDKSILDIASLEKGLRERIIDPSMDAYEERIKNAFKYTDEMVEDLINSQLALYLNVKKDKIDVIINLQKTPKSIK